MATDRDSLIATWETNYQEMRSLIASLEPSVLDRPTDNPGWTVRNLAAHIGSADVFTIMAAKKLSQGKNLLPIPLPGALFNWIGNMDNSKTVKKHQADGCSELVAFLESTHKAGADYLRDVPAEGFAKAAKVPTMGSLTLAEFLQRIVDHNNEHAAVLRRAIAN